MSVRMASPNEIPIAKGRLLSDILLMREGFIVGQFCMPAIKAFKIGKKFEGVLYLREISESEYHEKMGFVEIGDQNRNVGIV